MLQHILVKLFNSSFFRQDSKEDTAEISSLGAGENDHIVEDIEQMHIAPEEQGMITYLTISCNAIKLLRPYSLHFNIVIHLLSNYTQCQLLQ